MTMRRNLVVTATPVIRAVTATTPSTTAKKRKAARTPIVWDASGASVCVGKVKTVAPRRNSVEVVKCGIGPTQSGLMQGEEREEEEHRVEESAKGDGNGADSILAPYLVPSSSSWSAPEKKKTKWMPTPSAPKPCSRLSKRELQRRRLQSSKAKMEAWLSSVGGRDKTPSLVAPPLPTHAHHRSAARYGQPPSSAGPAPSYHQPIHVALPPLPVRGPVKSRLGPLPQKKKRLAEIEGELAVEKDNAANPGRKEQREAEWRKKREESEERRRMEEQDRLFWARTYEEDVVVDDKWASDEFSSEEEEIQEQRRIEWERKQKERRTSRYRIIWSSVPAPCFP